LPLTTGKNGTGDSNDFADPATWRAMRESMGDNSWPIPSDADLAVFRNYRDGINTAVEEIDYSNMIYIAGKDKATVCGYYNDNLPPRTELVVLSTAEGDQSVTWESGIPKKMLGTGRVYYTEATHGALANDISLFAGIEDLLEHGHTARLNTLPPLVRGEEKLFRTPEVHQFDISERGLENAVLGIVEKNEQLVNQLPVAVSISHGDLAYASYPVLAGHFTNDGILYAERSIDACMNNTLSARHAIGIYPGEIGTSAAIVTNPEITDFPGALIVGLGEPGSLTAFLLTQTIEQAISKYLLDVNNKADDGIDIGISALIVGCGYGGLSVESSVKAIIEGVNNANSKLSDLYLSNIYKTPLRLVQHIEFIEMYKDKALNCMYALRKIESKENNMYNIRIGSKQIKVLFGSKRRLATEAPEEWWRRITVRYREVRPGSKDIPALVFGASTGDAREEEKELFSSTDLVDLFVEQISINNNWSTAVAKTLFALMIPNEFKERLKKKGSINWILEKKTASYPWELLLDTTPNAKPLCVNAGMIRQLSTKDFRVNIKRVAGDRALVIGDPDLSDYTAASQLPGAKEEAVLVTNLLEANSYEKDSLINASAAEIIVSLLPNEYKIVHLAGHGVFNPDNPKKSGMLIGKDMFLTGFDIEQMNPVPELVFVNCCHLGRVDDVAEKNYMAKYKLAANLGTQLIQMGVKAVIAAGWAVHDEAAHLFASEFYTKMFAGCNFGDAVKDARTAVYEKYHHSNNTWGAYQCYGDPFYKLVNRSAGKPSMATEYIMAEQVLMELDNLRNDVDTRNYSGKAIIDKVKSIKEAAKLAGIRDAGIVEAEALIYYELGDYTNSVLAYEQLKHSQHASFSVSALEKYCNVRCKRLVEDCNKGADKQAAIAALHTIISELDQLRQIEETRERTNLIGSAWRRIAYLSSGKKKKLQAYKKAAEAYGKANAPIQPADTSNDEDEVSEDRYAFKMQIFMQWLHDAVQGTEAGEPLLPADARTSAITKLQQHKAQLGQRYRNMDYWELIEAAAIELLMLALQEEEAAKDNNWTMLEKKYRRIWNRAGSKGKIKAEMESFAIIIDGLSLAAAVSNASFANNVLGLSDRLSAYVAAE
ncbi:MAG TPA: CHAT domain-containing protein, partial [Chitinophagaceae bacterium]|nr:CHAT domain-containing protein [Chitinophagaceae bacterium]